MSPSMSSEDAQSVSSRRLSVDPLPIARLLTGETMHLKQEGPYRDGIAHPNVFSTLLSVLLSLTPISIPMLVKYV